MNTHRRLAHKDFINELALQVFLRGLRDPLRQYLKSRNPLSLAEALNLMTNEFQFENLSNYEGNSSGGSGGKKQNQNKGQNSQNKQGNKGNYSQNYSQNNSQNNKKFGNQGQFKPNYQNQNQGQGQNRPNNQNQRFNNRPSGSNNVATNKAIPMSGISHAHVTDTHSNECEVDATNDNEIFVEEVPEEIETTPFFQIVASEDPNLT